jgi:hypothetical protein
MGLKRAAQARPSAYGEKNESKPAVRVTYDNLGRAFEPVGGDEHLCHGRLHRKLDCMGMDRHSKRSVTQ